MTTQHTPAIDKSSLALNAREDMTISFTQVAGTSALVVDDVYRDPMYVRSLALCLSFHRTAGLYPGTFAFVSITALPLLALVNELIGPKLGHELVYTPFYRDDMVFAIVTTAGADLVPEQRKPHYDDFCDFAGLVYLNLPEQCAGGTSFWRHRKTGLQRALGTAMGAAMAASLGLANERELAARLLAADPAAPADGGYVTQSNDIWELTHVIPMRFNRLVVYSSALFHSPQYDEADFGNDLTQRRLTQNLYFDAAGAESGAGS